MVLERGLHAHDAHTSVHVCVLPEPCGAHAQVMPLPSTQTGSRWHSLNSMACCAAQPAVQASSKQDHTPTGNARAQGSS